MKVAIVIPCHERDRRFLPAAIESTKRVDAEVHVLVSWLPLSIALNRLIAGAVDAEYIVRLDVDDVINNPQALQHSLVYLSAFPSVQMAYGAVDGFDRRNPPGADVIFRRSLWAEMGGYDESLAHQEAIDFELRARRCYPGGIAYLEAGWYGYRRRDGSMSGNHEDIAQARAQISRKLNITLEAL